MTKLPERMYVNDVPYIRADLHEAAVAAARAEIEALREALQPFADVVVGLSHNHLNIEGGDQVYVSGQSLLKAYQVLATEATP